MARIMSALGLGLAVAAAVDTCCWCDADTPAEALTMTGSDARTYKLVFSDEFNKVGRTFANGDDAKWTALEIGDTSNKGTAFYLPEQATVAVDDAIAGDPVTSLLILTENASHVGDSPTGEKNIHMPYKSAMLQSWDKFCFTGGIVEFRARQPRGGGYWPALWLFGNLGRAVYQDSNTGLWPWSYDECDADLKLPPTDPPQRISACDDHDLAKDGLHGYQGRGATELDVLEGAVTNDGTHSYVVGSLQLSPGIPPYFRPPMFGFPTASGAGSWYTGLAFASNGFPNNGWYGPPWGSDCPTGCPDALSGGLVELDDLDSRYWTYRMEWKPGPGGHLSWFYDGAFVWGMNHESFSAYSVCSEANGKKDCLRTPPRMIPQEPMSIVMNTAIGTWNGGATALDGKHWPAEFFVDFVRVWQDEENVGCNPPDFPTKGYIAKHKSFYGEPAKPSGYDTCPESYPQSSHDNAAEIVKRGASHRTAQAAQAAQAAPAAGGPDAAPRGAFSAGAMHLYRSASRLYPSYIATGAAPSADGVAGGTPAPVASSPFFGIALAAAAAVGALALVAHRARDGRDRGYGHYAAASSSITEQVGDASAFLGRMLEEQSVGSVDAYQAYGDANARGDAQGAAQGRAHGAAAPRSGHGYAPPAH